MRFIKPTTFALGAAGILIAAGCSDETIVLPGPIIEIVAATGEECPNGGSTVASGIDENQDGALSEDEIDLRQPVCAGQMGEMGEQGIPGTNALIRTTTEEPGDNCDTGGIRIEVGLDENENSTLDGDEVQQTSFVCDGPEGQPGLSTLVRTRPAPEGSCDTATGILIQWGLDQNQDGVLADEEVGEEQLVCDGEQGDLSLVDVTDEPAGANCPVGGSRVDTGRDENRNGELDPEEVAATEYVCDAVSNRVRVSAELAGTSTVCPDGGTRIETGPDLNQNERLDDDEVTDTTFVCSGEDGQQTLVAVSDEPAGANCVNGGQRVETGVDANLDGTLQDTEVASTSYVCNGQRGQDGSGGNAVRVSAEPAGQNCPNGGTRIETGPDTNANGALDDPEVTNTSFACQGAATTTLVRTASEPAGGNCANGGVRIETGIDDNADGVLDTAEVDSTQFVCDTTTGTGVPFAITTSELVPSMTDIIVNDPFDAEITAVGGTGGGYSWSVTSGSLPPGLTLAMMGTPSSEISGTPTQTGTFTFTVEVTDFFGQTAQRQYTLEISPPPCAPGQDGAAGGGTLQTFSSPISISTSSYQIAADTDTSTNGYVYILGTSSLVRISKDSTRSDDVEVLAGLAAADLGYEMEIVGNAIYVVSDSTSGTSNRVQRISNDGGATFSIQDMMDFTAVGAPEDIRGIEIEGNTMYVVTHQTDCVIYEANIGGTLPAPASEVVTLTGYDSCTGFDVDNTYFYTTFGDTPDNDIEDGMLRIDRSSFALQELFADYLTFNLDDSGYNAIEVQDLDNDGLADIMFTSGDGGQRRYLCTPSEAGPYFSRAYREDLDGDNGLALEPTENVIWLYDEGGSPSDELFKL